MEILGKILGNPARVKIMRLFMLNNSNVFENKDIVKRSRVNPETVRKEIKLLASVGFVKSKKTGWSFNQSFKYVSEFENLLVGADTLDKNAIAEIFKKSGKVKLLAVAGTFIKNKESRVDLLIVGDKIKKTIVEEGIRKLEAEMGSEISYAIFETAEFLYRLNMYDKLVRDILDFPHEVVIESKELSTHSLKKN
ncbi:MAG: hypothetical protein NTZ44_03500 [Candidatus Nomurabacteria bacterium]|nr:hypothetical protein [Candidatus Nomurabacteria bacterium]